MNRPRRVLIYGCTGSGKTTLARELSAIWGLPLVDVDQLTFLPNWVSVPEAEQRAMFHELSQRDHWIFDTAYGMWLDLVFPRCELVIALDFPRWVSLTRLVRRTFMRVTRHEKVCGENYEDWRKVLSADSILVWHFRSFSRKRRRIDRMQREMLEGRVLRFRSSKQLAHWVEAQRTIA